MSELSHEDRHRVALARELTGRDDALTAEVHALLGVWGGQWRPRAQQGRDAVRAAWPEIGQRLDDLLETRDAAASGVAPAASLADNAALVERLAGELSAMCEDDELPQHGPAAHREQARRILGHFPPASGDGATTPAAPIVVEVAVEALEASHRRLLDAQGLIGAEIARVSLALRRAHGAVVPDPDPTTTED